MTTKRKTTALEEIKDVRRALLDLSRALLEVATGTIVTAANATFALVNETVARVRREVQAPTGARSAKRSRAANARLAPATR